MRSKLALSAIVPLLLAAAACGSDGDGSSSDEAAPATDPVEQTDPGTDTGTSTDDITGTDTTVEGDLPSPAASGGGTATLTLDNGETVEIDGLLCALEPQMAAGSEILFTATSYGDPGIDITQFGNEGNVTGVASITVYDGDYTTLWEATSITGNTVDLSLDGTTITGSSDFYPNDEYTGETVAGEVVANC